MSEQVVYRYAPARPGDYLVGVPRRDLTAADLARDPMIEARATATGPSGTPMYRRVRAEPTSPADPPKSPAKEPPKTGGDKE